MGRLPGRRFHKPLFSCLRAADTWAGMFVPEGLQSPNTRVRRHILPGRAGGEGLLRTLR